MKSNPQDLSDVELLSNFIPEVTANQLIAEYQSLYGAFVNTSPIDLSMIKGYGKSKLYKINCIKEILCRIQKQKSELIIQIKTPHDVAEYACDMEDLQQEEFRILMLNIKNKIIAKKTISKGTINASLVSPREVFSPAIKMMAGNIILVHNHPSGDPTPSKEDIEVTKAITKAGDIININVIDHIIIGKSTYCSFKEQGLLESE